jgi:hypothetical protein
MNKYSAFALALFKQTFIIQTSCLSHFKTFGCLYEMIIVS